MRPVGSNTEALHRAVRANVSRYCACRLYGILFPSEENESDQGPIHCRERLGGLHKFYHRDAGWID